MDAPAGHDTDAEHDDGAVAALDSAMQWTQGVVKAMTKLTDSDFEVMKLFDHPVLLSPSDAVKYEIVSAVAEPKIAAGSQAKIVV